MAIFNPDPGVAQADNFTGRSQGVPNSDVFETLFKGLGNAVGGIAQTLDVRNQSNIRKDVEAINDATNTAYGYDEAAATGTVPALDPEAIPADLKGTRDRFAKMAQARKAGKLSESHYWSLMTTAAKEVRAKYPGYSEIIDNIFADVTGSKPAIALRNSLENDYRQAEAEARAGADATQKRIWDMRDEISTLYPDYFSNPEKYAGREDEVINGATNLSAKRQQTTARKGELDLLASEDNLNEEEAEEAFTERGQMIVQNSLSGALNSIGFDPKTFMDQVAYMQKNGVDPDKVNELRGQIAIMKVKVQEDFMKLRSEKWAMTLPPQKLDEMQKNLMSQLEGYEKLLTDENAGLLFWHAGTNKVVADRAMTELQKLVPDTILLAALEKLSPAAAQWWLLRRGGASAIAGKVAPGALTHIFTGNKSISEVLGDVDNEKRIGDKDKTALATQILVDIEASFANPTVLGDQSVVEFMKKNFMGAEPEINKIWSTIDQSDWSPVFTKLTSPAIVDRIAKLKDPMLMKAYSSWVLDQWDNLPDTKTAIANLANSSQAKSGDITTVFDPKTKQLVAMPTESGIAKSGGDNVILNNMVRKQQIRLQTVNANLANLVYALEKAGVDPAQAVQQIFQINGVTIQTEETKEGTESGKGPLGGSPLDSFTLGDYEPGETGQPFEIQLASFNPDEPDGEPAPENILDFIGGLEAPKGYNQIYGRNKQAPLDSMTVDEVFALQAGMLRKGSPSTAVGRYQFLRKTLRGLKEELGLTGDELFDKELQDRLAMALLERRGYSRWKAGKKSTASFVNSLAKEWASLPTMKGNSYYAGDGLNKALTSTEKVLEVLASEA